MGASPDYHELDPCPGREHSRRTLGRHPDGRNAWTGSSFADGGRERVLGEYVAITATIGPMER
jgi:hypothetical protein